MVVRDDLCTAGGILHGGAYMAFADALGAIGGVLNLAPGTRTTTLESKTNFLRGAPVGSTVTGEATPLHIGRRSSVWQTRITNDEGKLMALVTQTQMTVEAWRVPSAARGGHRTMVYSRDAADSRLGGRSL